MRRRVDVLARGRGGRGRGSVDFIGGLQEGNEGYAIIASVKRGSRGDAVLFYFLK